MRGSASRPGRSLPPGKKRDPFYRRLGGPQGRSGQVRKISSLPGFDPRTVQPVASRYTDCPLLKRYNYGNQYFLEIFDQVCQRIYVNCSTNKLLLLLLLSCDDPTVRTFRKCSTNPHNTNQCTVLLLCVALLIICYMFRHCCHHQVADSILLKLTAIK